MLGSIEHDDEVALMYHCFDCQNSTEIFEKSQNYFPNNQNAIDIGAGIGRVSKFLLTRMFKSVDLVD